MSDSTGRSSGCSVRIVHGADKVRRTLLARSPDLVTIDESAVRAASRVFGETLTPVAFVERVIQEVRDEGDVAVRRIARALGDHIGPTFEIAPSELAEAGRTVDSALRADIDLAAERIRAYHEREMPAGFDMPDLGVGQRWVPVDRAGLHVPGQAAPLVSSLLMAAVPARVAGVGEIVVTTPVKSGGIVPALAAAAEAAGVDRVLGLGGAQAIAALALGTQSVPRCDVVVAPGNAWVMLATRALYGVVGVDLLPGPTETLVIADAAADAAEVAADLIAQAEHGGPASPIALTPDPVLADEVAREVKAQLATLPRAEVAWDSFEQRGGVGVVDDLTQAVELSNAYAPEHLCLLVDDPEALASAGSPCRRRIPGQRLAGGSGRLRGGTQPHHAHGRDGPLCLASGCALVPEVGLGGAPFGRPGGGAGAGGGTSGAGRGPGRSRAGRRTSGRRVTTMPSHPSNRDFHG